MFDQLLLRKTFIVVCTWDICALSSTQLINFVTELHLLINTFITIMLYYSRRVRAPMSCRNLMVPDKPSRKPGNKTSAGVTYSAVLQWLYFPTQRVSNFCLSNFKVKRFQISLSQVPMPLFRAFTHFYMDSFA